MIALALWGGVLWQVPVVAEGSFLDDFAEQGGGISGGAAAIASPTPLDFGSFEVLDQILGQGKEIGNYTKTQDNATPFTTLFNRLVQIAIGITVLVGVLGVVAGGYLYMTAQGNASQVEKGKDFIKTSLFAIVLAVASVLLLNTISPQFGEEIREPVLPTPRRQNPGDR